MMELCGETRGAPTKIKIQLYKKLPDTVFFPSVLKNIILKLNDESNGTQELETYLEQVKKVARSSISKSMCTRKQTS